MIHKLQLYTSSHRTATSTIARNLICREKRTPADTHTHTHKHLNTNSKIVNIHEEQLSLKTRTPNNRLRAGYALLASPPVASYTRPFSELCSVDFVSQRTTTNVPLLPALGECIDK